MTEKFTPLPDIIESYLHKKVESSFTGYFNKTLLRWFCFDIKKGTFYYKEHKNDLEIRKFYNNLSLMNYHMNVLENDLGISPYQYGFRIVTNYRTYILYAETNETHFLWIRGLNFYFNSIDLLINKTLKQTVKKKDELRREVEVLSDATILPESQPLKKEGKLAFTKIIAEGIKKGKNVMGINFQVENLHIVNDLKKETIVEKVYEEIEVQKETTKNQNLNRKKLDVKNRMLKKSDEHEGNLLKSELAKGEMIRIQNSEDHLNLVQNNDHSKPMTKIFHQDQRFPYLDNEYLQKIEEDQKMKFLDVETLKKLSKESFKNPIMSKHNYLKTLTQIAIDQVENKEKSIIIETSLKENQLLNRQLEDKEKSINKKISFKENHIVFNQIEIKDQSTINETSLLKENQILIHKNEHLLNGEQELAIESHFNKKEIHVMENIENYQLIENNEIKENSVIQIKENKLNEIVNMKEGEIKIDLNENECEVSVKIKDDNNLDLSGFVNDFEEWEEIQNKVK